MSKTTINEIEVNGIAYVPKGTDAPKAHGEKFIIRTLSAGVFYGPIINKELNGAGGFSVVTLGARRLWYWSGACSLSQMAVDGVDKPSECKFSVPASAQELPGVIEILAVTEKAAKSIEGVKEWKR